MSDTELTGAAAATSEMAAARASGDERLAYQGVFQRILTRPEIGAAIAALATWVLFWAVSEPFGRASGAGSVLDVASSPLGIMAVAVAMLMIGGEFDLSAGAATGALGIVTILLVRDVTGAMEGGGLSLWLALPISLAAALGLGWFNGTMVNRTSLPSFIVTLASFFVLKGGKLGFSKLLVGQQEVGKLDDLQAISAFIDDAGFVVKIRPDDVDFVVPAGVQVFEVVPPIIDVIEVNIADGLDPFTDIPDSAFDTGDKGYGFLADVFSAEWLRNEHVWNTRDWVYTIGIVGGLALCALAVYEMNFRRRSSLNPAGLAPLVGGAALAIVGIWRLHATNDVSGTTIGSVVIGAGMLVGFVGWGMWRYESRTSVEQAVDEMADSADDLSAADKRLVAVPFVLGAVASAAAVALALWLDSDNSEQLTTAFDLSSGRVTLYAVLVGLAFAVFTIRKNLGLDTLIPALQNNAIAFATSAVVVTLLGILFLYMATEQGARAIGFLALAVAGLTGLLVSVRQARRSSQALSSVLLIMTAGVVAAMAFFVKSESSHPKFRTQAFAILLILGALIAIWAVASLLFKARDSVDASADRFGMQLVLIGAGCVVVGLGSRLLYVTDAELLAEINPAKFSVRILWFFLFTAVCSWVLARTRFGSWTFAVGGNKEASRQVGVPAARTKTQLFMLVSFAAWLVGLLLAFRLNSIQANTGDGEEFEYIIAAVVGGTMLTGGYGSTIGAAIGAFIMAMSAQGIGNARWNSDWRFVFLGTILLLAVIANNFIRSKAEAAR